MPAVIDSDTLLALAASFLSEGTVIMGEEAVVEIVGSS